MLNRYVFSLHLKLARVLADLTDCCGDGVTVMGMGKKIETDIVGTR